MVVSGRVMLDSLYDLKPGMLIKVLDCHSTEPHIYEVSHIRRDHIGRMFAVSEPADMHHKFDDILGVYELQGRDYICIWTYEPKINLPEDFGEYVKAQWDAYKRTVLEPYMKGETNV